MSFRYYHRVRYEYKRWPLWRMDKNISYLLKSVDHVKEPWTSEDGFYYQQLLNYLAVGNWQAKFAPPDQGNCIRIMAGGDMMWIRSGWKTAISSALTEQLSTADLALINLETPIDPTKRVPKWTYETLHYNSPPDYLDAWRPVKDLNQRIFSICNNHALDQGRDGLAATRNIILNQPQFSCLGGLVAGEESAMVEVKGFRIACLATTFGINHLTHTPPAGIPLISFGNPHEEPDWGYLKNWLQRIKKNNPDLIVLIPHWGYEYEYWPDALMRQHAHQLIQMGFDIIIGTSPHVLQQVEIISINQWDKTCPIQIQRPGKAQCAVIAYSLGNFLSIMPTLACKVGALLQLDLIKNRAQETHLTGLKIIPTFTERGLDTDWLAAKVVSVSELQKWQPLTYHQASLHAGQFFKSLY